MRRLLIRKKNSTSSSSPLKNGGEEEETEEEEAADRRNRGRRNKREYNNEEYVVCLVRAPIMPLLHVNEDDNKIHFKPFVSPLEGHVPGQSEESRRKTLGARLRGISSSYNLSKIGQFKSPPKVDDIPSNLPPAKPLILWESSTEGEGNNQKIVIEVDPILTVWLREHQRQGVKFVFECLMGLRDFEGEGCILADDMGLGKTLQSITIVWTLLQQGFDGKPSVKKAAVICPASLVKNWASEIEKWLRGKCVCTPVAESNKDKVISLFMGFKYDKKSSVIIASYETFRAHVDKLDGVPIGLIVCDEAHRLKNDKTKTAVAIANLPAKKRLLLSGTPIQNDLDEFYSLVSLCNPNVLGDPSYFRKSYANPILLGREPDADEYQQKLAGERLLELSQITNLFILRRTNALLAKVLPPKVVMNIFCPLTTIQVALYTAFLESNCCRKLLNGSSADLSDKNKGLTGKVLMCIQSLMKLCNHPSLIKNQTQAIQGFEACEAYLNELENGGMGGSSRVRTLKPELSGKLLLVVRLLDCIRRSTKDRVVIISNYTQTLDIFQRLSKDLKYPLVRLDGATSIKKRHQLVTTFNDPSNNSFIFLLSSKSGGCGINLIGANRLIMYDPDWNPANDKQALARVWRDGQRKTCYIYRLFSTGTIEEKIYQRQICKDGLSSMIVSEGENQLKDSLSAALLKDLFCLKDSTVSDTHDMLNCTRCFVKKNDENHDTSNLPEDEEGRVLLPYVPQLPNFVEEDLLSWAHHSDVSTVPDEMLTNAIKNEENEENKDGVREFVTFVMSCKIEFNDIPEQKSDPQPNLSVVAALPLQNSKKAKIKHSADDEEEEEEEEEEVDPSSYDDEETSEADYSSDD